MNLITEVIFIFVIYSFFLFFLESVYKSILQKKIVNSGFLIGPFCPIYGYGALILYYALKGFANNIIILFIISFVVLSIWEYIVGVLLEFIFKTKYWDYSNNFLNIKGRVCLLNSVFWGILGVLFMLVIHPWICKVIANIPIVYLVVFIVVSITYIIVDTIITATNIIKVNIKLEKIEELEKNIKKRIKVMEDIRIHKERTRRKQFEERLDEIAKRIEEAMDGLEEGKEEIIKLIEKRTNRLRKAFPTMRYDKLFELFKEKEKKDVK